MKTLPTAEQLRLDWTNNPRWAGIERPYTAEDVVRLRGTELAGYSDWSGYISPARLASAATCQPER